MKFNTIAKGVSILAATASLVGAGYVVYTKIKETKENFNKLMEFRDKFKEISKEYGESDDFMAYVNVTMTEIEDKVIAETKVEQHRLNTVRNRLAEIYGDEYTNKVFDTVYKM